MFTWSLQTILCDCVLAVVINTSATLLSGAPFLPQTWYMETCTAFGTNVLLQLILPVHSMAAWVVKPLSDGLPKTLCTLFVENFLFVTPISATMALMHITAADQFLGVWMSTYLALVGIGYATTVILWAISESLARRTAARA